MNAQPVKAEPQQAAAAPSPDLLAVDDIRVHFPAPGGRTVHAVDGVSLAVQRGRTFGVVGESGSGKTTLALAVMRLVPITGGRLTLHERDITTLDGNALREVRRDFQMVFQDPYSSLNPRPGRHADPPADGLVGRRRARRA
ncbi:ATP-binding cassette domain-containing protein [Paracoccus suum]|uniref:ATP-binding cassette domain-containing protein n=1 Tax=Paracoccus suum TaxID=2259340 RepID=UPI002411058E|nr:ATP-binding cassette domain-containing protein [Paracoccus suum]